MDLTQTDEPFRKREFSPASGSQRSLKNERDCHTIAGLRIEETGDTECRQPLEAEPASGRQSARK